ncbi:MAG: DUF1552 domain-containing protein [Alphaproteobacteria bacterium]|nr:DUF1552 domain-containing protein [Alphaproteobacteria bacterium]
MKHIDRRAVLRGLFGGAAVSIGLPPLEAMMNASGTAWADGGNFPQRFVLWTWGNGIVPGQWVPAEVGEGDAWKLSPELEPLAALKRKVAVVTGTEVRAINSIPHYSGLGPFLSGFVQIGEEGAHTSGGPTIDQVIAEEIGKDTTFQSIETGAYYSDGLAFRGPNQPLPPERDPAVLFRSLFGEAFRAPGEDTRIDPRLALRQSVLDSVVGRIESLQGRLGSSDKARLDAHLTGIREIERRIAKLAEGPPDYESCARPASPLSREQLAEDPFEVHAVMARLVAMAFACDQTRVASHCFIRPVGNYQFPGTTEGHHQLTHNEPGDQPMVHANTVKQIEALATFCTALDEVAEGSETLLDHTIVLGTSDVSLGKTHAIDEWPTVIVGSGSGTIRTDVHYRSTTKENALKVPLTVIRAMGIARPSFGKDDGYTEDSLGALEKV